MENPRACASKSIYISLLLWHCKCSNQTIFIACSHRDGSCTEFSIGCAIADASVYIHTYATRVVDIIIIEMTTINKLRAELSQKKNDGWAMAHLAHPCEPLMLQLAALAYSQGIQKLCCPHLMSTRWYSQPYRLLLLRHHISPISSSALQPTYV